jgi:DNA-binding transcriptional LysR family regulator
VLETLPLIEEDLLLAVPRGHALSTSNGPLEVRELAAEPFVMLREGAYDLREQTLAACRRAGFEPQVALDGAEMDGMLRFVGAGIGIAILPEMVVADVVTPNSPVIVRPLRPRLTRSLVVARRRDRYFSAAAREFTSLLARTARSQHGTEGATAHASA